MNNMFTFMRESSVARFFIPAGLLLIIVGVVIFFINVNNQNYVLVCYNQEGANGKCWMGINTEI